MDNVFRPVSPVIEEEPDDISRPEGGSNSSLGSRNSLEGKDPPRASTVETNRRVSLPPMRLTSILEQDEKDKRKKSIQIDPETKRIIFEKERKVPQQTNRSSDEGDSSGSDSSSDDEESDLKQRQRKHLADIETTTIEPLNKDNAKKTPPKSATCAII